MLWSHGRITLHPREGAKPAQTIAKHGDWHAAAAYAKRHGFEQVGLIQPKEESVAAVAVEAQSNETTKGDAAMARPKDAEHAPARRANGRLATAGRRGELSPRSYERYDEVMALIKQGVKQGDAFAKVAEREGVPTSSIHSAFYSVRKRKGGERPQDVAERRHRAMHERIEAGELIGDVVADVCKREGLKSRDSLRASYRRWLEQQPPSRPTTRPLTHLPHDPAPPKPEPASPEPESPEPESKPKPDAREQALRQAMRPLQAVPSATAAGRGINVVEGEEVTDALRVADDYARQRVELFRHEHEAIRAAYAALEAEVNVFLERMGELEQREEQLRQGAAFFGVTFPKIVPEAD